MQFNFEKLEVWHLSKEFCKLVFNYTKDFPQDEKYILVSQIRRASLSVPSNIAEGSARISIKDKKHFYTISYSSLMEVVNHSIISYELNYISENQLNEIKEKSIIIAKMISKLRKNTQ